MAHYRKIQVRIWNDEKFQRFTTNGKLAFLFVLTHQSMTAIGAMRASVAGLAAELKVPRSAFMESIDVGMLLYDDAASCIVAPKFVKHNVPESPNVIKGESWQRALVLVPHCDIKLQQLASIEAFLKGYSKAYGEAFAELMAMASLETSPKEPPNQEQEQDTYPPYPPQAGGGKVVNGNGRRRRRTPEERFAEAALGLNGQEQP